MIVDPAGWAIRTVPRDRIVDQFLFRHYGLVIGNQDEASARSEVGAAIDRWVALGLGVSRGATGEALFDPVEATNFMIAAGVVVFTILLSIALGAEPFSLASAANDFLREAGGGALLGLIVGWIAYRAMRSIDDYNIEVMISLAVVMGGYSLALALHVSGPVAMAIAGLLIGNAGVADAMSDVTQDYLIKFWELIDEILNSVLFLLIGLEVIALAPEGRLAIVGLCAIVLVMGARAISVGIPLKAMKRTIDMGPLAFPTLVWGGLRGGISVALALSLPDSPMRTVILAATYAVVLFAVIVQGGSIGWLIARIRTSRIRDGGGDPA